jgi:hypothetical protein
MPLLVKAHLALFAKATMAVSQVEFIMLVAPYDRHRYLTFSYCIAATGIQDLDPLKHLAQVIIVCASITNHASAQCPRNADAKLESAPAQRRQFMQQTRPTDTSLSYQKRSPIAMIFNAIGVQSDMGDHTPHTGISIQDVRALPSDEQRNALLGTQAHQTKQFFPGGDCDPEVYGTTDPQGAVMCQRLVATYPFLKVRAELIV